MFKKSLLAITLLAAVQANAALVVNTGTPSGAGFPLSLDGNDWLAGQVNFSQALTINAIKGWLNDGTDGLGNESFTISLYADAGNTVGSLLDSTGAQFLTAQGVSNWNGASGLNWAVGPGTYWVGFEVQGNDSFGGTAPIGAPSPLARYAFNDGGFSGYRGMTGDALGVQIDATVAAVPEPATLSMLLAGIGLMGFMARRRQAR
jgi:hypothetical protein